MCLFGKASRGGASGALLTMHDPLLTSFQNSLGSAAGRSAIFTNFGNFSRNGSGTLTLAPFSRWISSSAFTAAPAFVMIIGNHKHFPRTLGHALDGRVADRLASKNVPSQRSKKDGHGMSRRYEGNCGLDSLSRFARTLRLIE